MQRPVAAIQLTNKIFEGNPAGVIFSEFLPNEVMQKIALENNLSETAFVYEEGNDYFYRMTGELSLEAEVKVKVWSGVK